MRRFLRWPATLARPFRALTAARDERNIRRLGRHVGCSIDDARELYRLSRRDGYGAAHEAVFGVPPGQPRAQPSPAIDRLSAEHREVRGDAPVFSGGPGPRRGD
jgi:hypothetical protein